MKNKISLLFLISSLNLFSQTSKAEIINFELIVEAMNPILSDFIIKEKPNSNYLLKEYGFESMYGEFKIKESPNRIDTLSYNEKGVLKYEKVNSDFNFNNDGFRSRNELYFEYPSKIGEKGELINQPNIKYKYNSKGQIIDLIGYLIDGSEIKEHYSFIYNEKNQITEIQHYWGNSKTINDISDYTYNKFGDIIFMKNYSKTTRKEFPIWEQFKIKWNYNIKNQLVSFHSYKTNYGNYWEIGKDMYKYIKGKKILKTYAENQKDLQESYQELQNFEYKYDNNTNVWTSRTEYSIKPYSTIPKEFIRIVYQTELK